MARQQSGNTQKPVLTLLGVLVVVLVAVLAYRYFPRKKFDILPLVPVSGRILVEGAPLDRGRIHLVPAADRGAVHQYYSSGDIQADGSYSLTTYGRSGAPLGKYKVMVVANRTPIPEYPLPSWKPDWLVHRRYTKRTTTDLEMEVVASPAAQTYDLDLER